MTLNIHVDADLHGIWAAGREVRKLGRGLDEARAQARRASAASRQGWDGEAAAAFRGTVDRVGTSVDDWASRCTSFANRLETTGDRLRDVKQEMQRARGIASQAGLLTTESTIAEPGPPVVAPAPLPTGRGVRISAADRQPHADACAAALDHQRKVRAYNQAADVVEKARKDEKDALDYLSSFADSVVQSSPFTIADIAAGVAGASIERTSKFRKQARQYSSRAAQWDRLAKNRTISPHGRARAIMQRSHYRVQASSSLRETTGRLSRLTDDISPIGKRILTAKFAKGLPVVGSVLGVAQAGWEVYAADTTEEKIQAGFSAGSSLLAGAAVGAAVGGPVGAVAGAVVAVGVGYAVNEWGDDAVDVAQGAAGAVGDAASAVGDFVDDIDLNPF